MNLYNKSLMCVIITILTIFFLWILGTPFCSTLPTLKYVVVLILIATIFIFWNNRNENFKVIVNSPNFETVKLVDLSDFFKFVEYYQTTDMDSREKYPSYGCGRNDENSRIAGNIINLLEQLDFIVNSNNQDNFYHRFLIKNLGSNLSYDCANPFNPYDRWDADAISKHQIGKQFTYMKPNHFNYFKKCHGTKHQYPLPDHITVHNYYRSQTILISLNVMQRLFDLVADNNPEVFSGIYRPTEFVAFEREFYVPLKSIRNSMLAIVNTDVYLDYLQQNRFSHKYAGIIFNPFNDYV